MANGISSVNKIIASACAGALLVSAILFFYQKTIEDAETWAKIGLYFLMGTLALTILDFFLPARISNALQHTSQELFAGVKRAFRTAWKGIRAVVSNLKHVSLPSLSFVFPPRWWKLIVVATALALFLIPFFWFERGEADYGGDSSRLYFLDPLTYLKQRALFAIGTSDFGFENPMFAMIPFLGLLQLLKILLLNNSWALLAVFNGLLLAGAFLGTYALIRAIHENDTDDLPSQLAAYLGGLLFVFSPLLTFSWMRALFRFHEIALYPLLTLLLLRFIQKKSYASLFGALMVTAVFALNFGFHASPSLFAAWPFLIVVLFGYAALHKRLAYFLRGLAVFVAFFLLLHAFHILPTIAAFANTASSFYQSTFTVSGKINRGLHYFESNRPTIRLIYNLARTPQYLLYSQTVSSQELLQLISRYAVAPLPFALVFPILITFGLVRSSSDNKTSRRNVFLVTSVLFVISLFLITANLFGQAGPRVYAALFAIPGFAMFRSFSGVFAFIFLFLFALTLGLGLRYCLAYFRSSLVQVGLSLALLVPLVYSAIPFIRGDIVNVAMNDTRDVSLAHRFSPDFIDSLAWVARSPLDAKYLIFPLAHYDYQVIEGEQGGAYVGPSPLALLAGKPVFSSLSSFDVPDSALFNQNFFLNRMLAYDIVTLNRLFSLMNIDFIFLSHSPNVYQEKFTGWPYSQEIFRLFPSSEDFTRWTKHFGYRSIYENGPYAVYQYSDFFLPRFHTPRTIVKRENPDEFKEYLISKEGYDIRTALYRVPATPNEIISVMPENIPNPPLIEFRKLSPVKYRLRVKDLPSGVPLIFSQLFHPGWKLFPTSLSSDPATGPKFVSENFNGAIQNDNLPDIRPLSTWRRPAVDERYHLRVNEYANSWWLDPEYLRKNFPAAVSTSPAGKVTAEFIVEFTPQRFFVIGSAISALTFAALCGLLILRWRKSHA